MISALSRQRIWGLQSLLWVGRDAVRLAPAYDMFSTTIYEGSYGSVLSRNMGIRMGAHSDIDKVKRDDVADVGKCFRQPLDSVYEI